MTAQHFVHVWPIKRTRNMSQIAPAAVPTDMSSTSALKHISTYFSYHDERAMSALMTYF